MGKNRDIESLIRLITNVVVHKIMIKYTNKPESRHFLNSEIIEYSNQTENLAEQHNWNDEDKEYIKEKVLKKIKEMLAFKYQDVKFSLTEAEKMVEEEIINLGM